MPPRASAQFEPLGTDTHLPTDRDRSTATRADSPALFHRVCDVCTLAWLNHIWHHIWHINARDPTAYRPVSEWQPQLAAPPLRSTLTLADECLRDLRTSHSHRGTSARCNTLLLTWPEWPSSARPVDAKLQIPVAFGLCRWLCRDTRQNGFLAQPLA